MFAAMRAIALMLLWSLMGLLPGHAVPPPESVAILYNMAVPESRKVAELYQKARGIPAGNLIALEMPVAADVSRADYERMIAGPLRSEFDRRGWWKRRRDRQGVTLPVVNRIRVLVTVRGVPLRIKAKPKPKPPEGQKPAKPEDPLKGRDEASVDSELAMFGVEGVPTDGVLQNKFYKAGGKSITGPEHPFLVLTARIDAPRLETCERMIRDAVEVEKAGLWGMAFVDIANKFPQGDQWLEEVVEANAGAGIPTVVDRFNATYPKHYPMGGGAAVYYGWYDWHVSGPFLDPRFQLRKGAVAVHLHSFSAQQLRNAGKNWSGPLLEKGAAVTVGNVFEPYLHLTHDLGVLQRRLLAGDCWVEACWKAMPATSWQGVVLGDPLYRPFLHLDGGGEVAGPDKPYRALRAAMVRWKNDAFERRLQLGKAAERMASGPMYEALGLELMARALSAEGVAAFRKAKARYVGAEDKMRQDFQIIAGDRAAGRKDLAIRGLRDAQTRYGAIPAADALQAWLDILDPPPPPPAKPTKKPVGKKP